MTQQAMGMMALTADRRGYDMTHPVASVSPLCFPASNLAVVSRLFHFVDFVLRYGFRVVRDFGDGIPAHMCALLGCEARLARKLGGVN